MKDMSLLGQVRIASPCPMSWHDMEGDDQVRFCHECKLNVYNLSSMTKPAAESLLEKHEGRLCVGYYQRADGTIITSNCPVGLRAARKAATWLACKVAAAVVLLFQAVGVFAGGSRSTCGSITLQEIQPFKAVSAMFAPTLPRGFIAGRIAAPTNLTLGKTRPRPTPPSVSQE